AADLERRLKEAKRRSGEATSTKSPSTVKASAAAANAVDKDGALPLDRKLRSQERLLGESERRPAASGATGRLEERRAESAALRAQLAEDIAKLSALQPAGVAGAAEEVLKDARDKALARRAAAEEQLEQSREALAELLQNQPSVPSNGGGFSTGPFFGKELTPASHASATASVVATALIEDHRYTGTPSSSPPMAQSLPKLDSRRCSFPLMPA
ncbi:unnamed protein product, partial [Polarella glacialis]